MPLEPVYLDEATGQYTAPSLNYQEKRADWQVGGWCSRALFKGLKAGGVRPKLTQRPPFAAPAAGVH